MNAKKMGQASRTQEDTRSFARCRGDETQRQETYYYTRRAEEELSAAQRASHDDIAEVHRELASRYLRLADVSGSLGEQRL